MKEVLPSLLDLVRQASVEFETGNYEYCDGAYYFDSKEPSLCLFCRGEPKLSGGRVRARRRPFHRHGWYSRNLLTFTNGDVDRVTVYVLRWLCTQCGHTVSQSPPNILRRRRVCVLVVFILLWVYLNSSYGVERCDFGVLNGLADRKRILRSLRDARATALATQQSIREAMLKKIKPETWERLTLTGLSPPPSGTKCRNSQTQLVWETLSLLKKGADALGSSLNTLLARANERSLKCQRPFLLQIHPR